MLQPGIAASIALCKSLRFMLFRAIASFAVELPSMFFAFIVKLMR